MASAFNTKPAIVKQTFCIIASLAALVSMANTQALAQYNQQKNQSIASPPESLKEKVSLPDIPDYTGQPKFISGFTYHVPKQGPSYVMTFNVKEDRNTVFEWWKNTLQMYKWNMLHSGNGAMTATNKDGNMVTIQISGPEFTPEKLYRASYKIRYIQKEK